MLLIQPGVWRVELITLKTHP